jgi:hypothetical protein
MSINTQPPTLPGQVSDIFLRLRRLEQNISDPSVVGVVTPNPTFESITIGAGATARIIQAGVSPVTGLSAVPGATDTDIYVDVAWSSSDNQSITYDVILAYKDQLTNLYTTVTAYPTALSSTRINGLRPGMTYGVRVTAVNILGQRSTQTPSTGWLDFTTGFDAVPPSKPGGLEARAGVYSVTAYWDEVPDVDVARAAGMYEIHVDTVPDFNSENFRSAFTSATIASFTDMPRGAVFYVRVRAVDASGNVSPWSDVVQSGASIGGTPDDGTITSDKIVTAGLNASVIKFGSMSGDRIQTNSLDAATIKSSSITSSYITVAGNGRILVGTNPYGTGIAIDAIGIRLFSAGQVTVQLNAIDGSSYFGGALNAASGTFIGELVAATGTFFGTVSSYSGTSAAQLTANVFGNEPGLRFLSTNYLGLRPCIYVNTGNDSLHMLSGELVPGNSGRTELQLYKDHFILSTQFVANVAPSSDISSDSSLRLLSVMDLTISSQSAVRIFGSGGTTVSGQFNTDTNVANNVFSNAFTLRDTTGPQKWALYDGGGNGIIFNFGAPNKQITFATDGTLKFAIDQAGGYNVSTLRTKEAVQEVSAPTGMLDQAQLYTYAAIGGDGTTYYGLMAEQLQVDDRTAAFVVRDQDGVAQGVRYDRFAVVGVLELRDLVRQLEGEVASLRAEVEELRVT